MMTTTLTEFRKNLKYFADRINENLDTLIINRGKNRGIVVLSLDEYNALCATRHETSSGRNKSRLDSAIKKLNEGKSHEKSLVKK